MIVLIWAVIALLAAEIGASKANWRGLSLLGRRRLPLTLALLMLTGWLLVRQITGLAWWQVALGVPLGLMLFVGVAAWRHRKRTPNAIFVQGERDGRRIQHVAIPIENGPMPGILVEPSSSSTSALLIVHGAGDHKTFYAWPRLHEFAGAGFVVLAIDVDGHGENPRVLSVPDVLEDVRASVAWLRERYARVAVLGISQGGCIAARAVAEGVTVDALVIMEAPITVHVTQAVIRREARIVAHPAAWALHSDVGTLGLIQGWKTTPQRTRIGTVQLIEWLDIVGSVQRVTCPLLLCYAGSDAVVPREQAHTIAAAAPPHARFMLVPRATHLSLSIDRRVLRRIAAWLHEQKA